MIHMCILLPVETPLGVFASVRIYINLSSSDTSSPFLSRYGHAHCDTYPLNRNFRYPIDLQLGCDILKVKLAIQEYSCHDVLAC